MSRLTEYDCSPKELSPLALAFVGDGVYDLIIREKLVCEANRPVKTLNQKKVDIVRCQAQAELVKKIEPFLTDEEKEVFRRGRNTHTGHCPKNASAADYHMATGFEALIGYLYLCGNIKRINELINSEQT